MPGLLKPDACCPECGIPIVASCRTTNHVLTVFEYFHDPFKSELVGKPEVCVRSVDEPHVAQYELETYEPLHVPRPIPKTEVV